MAIDPNYRGAYHSDGDRLEEIVSVIQKDIILINAFRDNPPGYHPAALPEFCEHTSRSLLKILSVIQKYRPKKEDTPRNRSKEARVMRKLGNILSDKVELEFLGSKGADMRRVYTARVEALFYYAMDLWTLASRYKCSYEDKPLHKAETVRMYNPLGKAPQGKKRNSSTQVFSRS